jgi:uncharacterized oligopeptide transporter (OPT) family protein
MSAPAAPAAAASTHAEALHEAGHGALKHLTEEQVQAWTLEQKDRWWLENVYRGDMPQLTVRSALTGMLLGMVLVLPNLFIGAKTGWTLGFGVTSVIASFGIFKVLSKLRLGSEMTLLENNAMQSIATAAGYMTGPLIASIAAYMMFTNSVVPKWQVMLWSASLSCLGVLFAFPLKKRFINDEQLPFPEGRAAGVVMHGLHTGGEADGVFQSKLLAGTAAIGGAVTVLKSEGLMHALKLGFLRIPEYLDGWLYRLWQPSVMGTQLSSITVRAESDLVMVAAGGLMGIRTGVSLMIGAVLNYFVLVPWMIQRGDIVGKVHDGVTSYSLKDITFWSLWAGVSMMTTSSLFGFFSKPKVIVSAVTGLFKKKDAASQDILREIELPMPVFAIGIPVMGTAVVLLAHAFFGVSYVMGALAIPLVFVFTLIAVNSTGLTSITPTGSLGKLTQLTYGFLAPGNVPTNLMTAGITAEVASNASNLLMDIKPGYMLGGKPRHQALGHVLGILAGTCVAVPFFYLLYLQNGPEGLVTDDHPMPGAVQWKAVATVLSSGLSNLKPSAQVAALAGALAGIVLEALKTATKGRFWLSAVGVGLAFVLPFTNCLTMFTGAFLVWLAEHKLKGSDGLWNKVLVKNAEATCAGIVAGGGILGVVVTLVETFVLAP